MAVKNDFSRGSVAGNILRLAVPLMLAQLVNVLYNVVDRIFIGHIGGSALPLTGVGLCMPVITVISAFSGLFGMGGAPICGVARGRGDIQEAEQVQNTSFVLLVGCGLLLTVLGEVFLTPILTLFGASADTMPYAAGYLRIYLLGTVFVMISLGMNYFINTQGFAGTGMLTVAIGAVLNLILDPVFIFGFDMGVAGAAVATVLSQLASCLYVLRFLFSKTVPVAVTFGGYDGRLMLRILAVGMTPFLIIGVDNIMIISMNAILQSYGGAELGDRLVTCATIAQSFMLVVTMPLGGISAGTGTILAYNYGARRRDRILKAQAFIAGLCAAYVTLLFLLARLGGALFVRLFTTEPALAAEALDAIHICTLALIPLGLQYAIVDGFTGMGKVQLALPLSAFRKAVYFIALFALPAAFGARATFYAEPISDILGPIVSIIVYALAIRRILSFPPDPPAAEAKAPLPS